MMKAYNSSEKGSLGREGEARKRQCVSLLLETILLRRFIDSREGRGFSFHVWNSCFLACGVMIQIFISLFTPA